MKQKLILGFFLIFLFSFGSHAQNTNSSNTEYCILRIYGVGYLKSWRGIYVVYENLETEKFELEGTKPEDVLRGTMKYLNLLKEKGYTLVSSSTTSGSTEMFEYVFKKE